MEYLRGWRVMRQDPDWMGKVGSACLLMLSGMCVPLLGQLAVRGWTGLMLRRAVSGQDSPLPPLPLEFDYLGKLLNVGIKPWLVNLIWSLPLVALIFGSVCCVYAAMFGAMGAIGAGGAAGGEVGAGIGGVFGLCLMLGFCIVYPIAMIAIMMPMQIAIMRAEITDDINYGMRFKEVIDMTKLVFKELFVGQLVMMLIGMIAGFASVFTLYLLLFPSVVVMMVIQSYWHAEIYRVYLEKGGQPLPIGPLEVHVDRPNVPPAQHPGQPGQWGTPPQY